MDCVYIQALLATQQRIQQLVPDFRFNLGFSGKYFHHGTSEENLGDDMLLGKCLCGSVTYKATRIIWFDQVSLCFRECTQLHVVQSHVEPPAAPSIWQYYTARDGYDSQ